MRGTVLFVCCHATENRVLRRILLATRSRKHKGPKLRIIPLGGLGEIGKNMTVLEYGDDIIVVDIGSMFPNDDMPGIDLVIPDVNYLIKNKERIRGYVITHGHEDHIGASPYILQELPAPVYGSRLTLALVDHKLKEHRVKGIQLNVVNPGDKVKLGVFEVEFIKVSHSIAGAYALAIKTPLGMVIMSGDFKIDYTPIDNEPTDLGRFAELGKKGVLALLCESTNVERPGYTMSERKIGDTFEKYFNLAQGRIFIAMFASNIHRIQMVVDKAVKFGRKVCMNGRSMVNVTKLAMQLGDLVIPDGYLIDINDLDKYDDDQVVILTTGSQGEPMSGLTRMAFAEHRKLEIRAGDMVIISATPIPGNEKSVSRVINQLVLTGADVIYDALAEVHVSGHARQEELKLIHLLTKPKFFIPIHGEYRMLHHHALLAVSMGMPEENILIPDIGEVVEISSRDMHIGGKVPAGSMLIDGLGIGDVGAVVLRDRKHLSEDGLLVVTMAVDKKTHKVVSGPEVISRGFVYMREAEDMVDGAKMAAKRALDAYGPIGSGDWAKVKNDVRDAVSHFVYDTIKRDPMILPIIMEI